MLLTDTLVPLCRKEPQDKNYLSEDGPVDKLGGC